MPDTMLGIEDGKSNGICLLFGACHPGSLGTGTSKLQVQPALRQVNSGDSGAQRRGAGI